MVQELVGLFDNLKSKNSCQIVGLNDNLMTEVQLLKKIGQRIKEIREEKGITQDNLGIAMSMDKRTVKEYDKSNVSRLESGKTNPRIFTLYRVSKALGVTLDELMKVE